MFVYNKIIQTIKLIYTYFVLIIKLVIIKNNYLVYRLQMNKLIPSSIM
jgi:hypothetical protein